MGYGGQERQLSYLLEMIDKKSYEVSLVVWNSSPEQIIFFDRLKQYNIHLICFEKSESSLKKTIQLRKLIKKYKPVLIHSFGFSRNFFMVLATLFTNTVAIGALRNSFEQILKKRGFLLSYLNGFSPKFLISNNLSGLLELKARTPFFLKRNFFVVNNKMDLDNFKYSPLPSTNKINSVSVGSLFPQKRIDLMVEVIDRLVQSGVQIYHQHAGGGPLLDDIQQRIDERNLNDNFVLLGDVDKINLFISPAHLFLHTADYEGMPNVIMEAMSSGKAIVTTKCGDVPFMIEEGKEGHIVPCGDIDAFVDKALSLIQNPNALNEMGINGRAKALDKFGLQELHDEIFNFYEKNFFKIPTKEFAGIK